MVLKKLGSTPASTTTMTSSSNLPAPVYGNDCLELVWKNGQVIVQRLVSSNTTTTATAAVTTSTTLPPPLKASFSNFLRPSVLITKSIVDENKAAKATKAAAAAAVALATSSKSPDHSGATEGSSRGSGGRSRNNEDFLVPCKKCEGVGDRSRISIHGSSGHFDHKQTSKRKLCDARFCNELPVMDSSSVCSLGASNNVDFCSSKQEEMDDSSIPLSDNGEETDDVIKVAREGTRGKRNRNTEIHKLYEKDRRDKINKKMRVLKELIPNCKKVDKVSMLDDAIEYIKTLQLQLQLQIMSMGSGLCTPLMMLPSGPHHHQIINTSHIPHHFPIPASVTHNNKNGMFGFPTQLPPMPMPITTHAPFTPNMLANKLQNQFKEKVVLPLSTQIAIEHAPNHDQGFLPSKLM